MMSFLPMAPAMVSASPMPSSPSAEEPIFYAYALHGGAPCSLYIGEFPKAFAEALAYQTKHGGSVHLDQVAS